jgi:NlpC/P60 family putative phage cell wall peptidase
MLQTMEARLPNSSPAEGRRGTRTVFSSSIMKTEDQIIAAARGWVGTPYLHQASLKDVGCDCLGLVRGVWREVYGEEPEMAPPYVADWAEATGVEALAEAARRHMKEIAVKQYAAGDLLLFRWRQHLPAKHAGLATHRDRMIHAQENARVSEVWLTPWWERRIAYAFRFPGVK